MSQIFKPLYCIVLLFSMFGCVDSNKHVIENFELQHHQIVVTDLKEIESFEPFYGKDSVVILRKYYDTVYHQKITELETYKATRNNTKTTAQNALSQLDSPKMIEAFENRIRLIEEEEEMLNKIIFRYKNHPELTQLQQIKDKIAHYKAQEYAILGYTLLVDFTGKQGLLPKANYSRIYFFAKDKQTIISTIQP